MALDPRYVTTVSLDEYFVNKSDGTPNAFGQIFFWEDDNRTVPKNVYQLVNLSSPPTPPNYAYVALPNPITLSAVGTPSDNSGNNIAIYYLPVDAADNEQLYFVQVFDQFGVLQEEREAWPNPINGGGNDGKNNDVTNQLSNPQFADVLFNPALGLTINYTGAATDRIKIAPDWDLVINHTGAGAVTITRTSIQGSLAYPGNPPYTLTITAGLNLAALQLVQRLPHNPDIFGRAAGGTNGYLSASILLAPASSVTVAYQPNAQPVQNILVANNLTGAYTQYNHTIQLDPAINPSTSDTGYVDIILDLPILGATTFSNVQIVCLDTNVTDVRYDQTTVNRENDFLFHYYNPLLQYKPVPSYLVGWDFPLNPAQTGATVVASAIGANASKYVWDQTIIFQSANSGVGVTRHANRGITLTAAATTQMALIQYLPQSVTRDILNDAIAANVAAFASVATVATVDLFYTTDVGLPNLGAGASLVATLDANGAVATFNGTWTRVPRSSLGNAQFTIATSATNNFNDYGFSGWNLNGAAGASTATFFAIVVGTAQVTMGNTITFGSVSACRGYIPTRPAAQAPDEVFRECQYYYEQSYPPGVPVGTVSGGDFTSGNKYTIQSIITDSARTYSFILELMQTKVRTPLVTFYSNINANTAGVLTFQAEKDGAIAVRTGGALATNPSDISALGWGAAESVDRIFYFAHDTTTVQLTLAAVTGNEAFLIFHYTADARLGLV